MLVRPTNDIVAITVPCQGIRAQDIRNTVVFESLFLRRGIGKVAEGYFTLGIDCLIDRVDEVIDLLILRLDAVGNRNVALESRCVVAAGQRQKL